MNYTEIRLLWNGTDWEIDSSGPPHGLVAGTEFLLRLPLTVAALHPIPAVAPPDTAIPAGEGRLLFPAGTWLYLPLNPVKNEDKLWALWVAHREAEKPALAKSPDKPLVPILLEEALRFAHVGSRGLAACSCRIGERAFDSLNQAASHALLEWTANEAGAINVFDGVRFIHDKALVRLRDQRSHLLDGDPLPENPLADDGTPPLFPELEG
ncbi:MAG: hypothetical protein MUF86_15420 [Akkermansiaceae bacterium]|nr:hypothetical protein [Akkermansiaceae bacterium]